MNKVIFVYLYLLLSSCSTFQKSMDDRNSFEVNLNTEIWYDQTRQREIPVAISQPKTITKKTPQKVVIVNHGYGYNRGADYLVYTYLTDFLASKGFFVISIQHELSTDSLLPLTGNPQVLRRPFWDRGADNIQFVIQELKSKYPKLDFQQIALIGHSNGGDMVALFPQKYPKVVQKIITLDNRRMAFPRSSNPKVYSLRSSDQPTDEGVLPSETEIKKYGMKIIKLPNITHNEMDDKANDAQRKEIQGLILSFLAD